jgi:Predicted Zn-dependent peptidases
MPLETHSLTNGISVYGVKDHIQPVLQIEWVFPAGLWYEHKTALAQMVCALLKSGTSEKSSYQINEWIEFHGASLQCVAGTERCSIILNCLSKHAAVLIPLIYELLTDCQFPLHEIEVVRQNSKQRLSMQLEKSDFVANRTIGELLFGKSHPYGRYVEIQDYDLITQTDLSHHLQTHFTSKGCKIFMAGAYDDTTISLFEKIFGQTAWNAQLESEQPSHSPQPATEKKHRIVHDEQSVQGAIRLASPFPNRFHPDFRPMVILNTVFGGYFGSRLMSNIREEKGYTYGIHSYAYPYQYEGGYLITTEAGKEVCEAVVEEIYKEMKLLRDELIPEDELLLVKNYILGNLLGDIDGSFKNIQRWKSLILSGYSEQDFYQHIQLYKTIDADSLRELANRYYQPERFYELIIW